MIKEHEKLIKGELTVEVNWSKEVTPCKEIKLTIDGNSTIISNSDLYSLLIILSDDKQIDKLFVEKRRKIKQITKMVKMKTKKSIKAGEYLVFPLSYWVPEDVYDDIAKLENLKNGISEDEARKKLNN